MFKLEEFHRNITNKELLDDLLKTYNELNKKGIALSSRSYNKYGEYSSETIACRFSSWNKGVSLAKIPVINEKDINDTQLFSNLKDVWIAIGRQPKIRDMTRPNSRYSWSTYASRYGTWRQALECFLNYCKINDYDFNEQNEVLMNEQEEKKFSKVESKRTKRNISDRLRFKILMRDGFTCKSCGASATNQLGTELHIDHILPWSKGGETVESNLETKCKKCNLGKGNAFNK